MTTDEWERAGAMPYDEALRYFNNAPGGYPVELAEARWGKDYAKHGFMHVTDHQAAWEVVHPGVVATYFDIEDSLNRGGDALITEARRIVFAKDGPSYPEGSENNRLELYTQMYGVSNGLRIASGRMRDPMPGKVIVAYKENGVWGVRYTEGQIKPVDPPPPPVPPAPPAPPKPPGTRPKIPAEVMDAMTKIVQYQKAPRRRDAMDRIIMPWIRTIADPE